MIEPGHDKETFEKVKKEWNFWRSKEKEAKENEPIFLDHVRTSSGVRFRKYYITRGNKR